MPMQGEDIASEIKNNLVPARRNSKALVRWKVLQAHVRFSRLMKSRTEPEKAQAGPGNLKPSADEGQVEARAKDRTMEGSEAATEGEGNARDENIEVSDSDKAGEFLSESVPILPGLFLILTLS